MKIIGQLLLGLFSISLLCACAGKAPATATAPPQPTHMVIPTYTPTTTRVNLSPDIKTYLDNALQIIEDNSIYTGNINWDEIRAYAYLQAENTETFTELYPILETVIHKTGDRHGYLMPPADINTYFNEPLGESLPKPEYELIQNQIGYLRIPSFMSGNNESTVEFVSSIQSAIKTLDAQNPCGWVVDVRGNAGGNGIAMLLGLSLLLEEGVLGGHTYKDGTVQAWRTKANQIFLGDLLMVALDEPAYQLNRPESPIAVLTDEMTTSAGEMVAVAFSGWEYTRSFGQPTLGRTTAPHGYMLEDGAALGISVAFYSDHTGQIYKGKIIPDDLIVDHQNPILRNSSVPEEAFEWLFDQESCEHP